MTKFESSGSTEHPSNLDLSHLVAPEHAASRVRCFNNTIDGRWVDGFLPVDHQFLMQNGDEATTRTAGSRRCVR